MTSLPCPGVALRLSRRCGRRTAGARPAARSTRSLSLLVIVPVVALALGAPQIVTGAPDGAALAGEAPAPESGLALGTFEHDTPGRPPEGWKARGGDIEDVYTVRNEQGDKYLHADARGTSVQIGKEQSYDVSRYPVLTWRWRVTALPEGGDERKKATGDSAAGVYVVFGGWPIPKTVKYVWSATLPPGTRTESPFAGQTKIVVLESGTAKAGRWVEERVNVLEDYRKFFGEDPGEAKGIGILSDADNTKSRAVADYDDIVARPAGDARPRSGQGAPGPDAAASSTRVISEGAPPPGTAASPRGVSASGEPHRPSDPDGRSPSRAPRGDGR